MAYKIIVKKRFTDKVTKLPDYLEKAWNKDVAGKFLQKLDTRINHLPVQTYTGIELRN